jgi:hypoxanthine-DNA glycosylase
MLETHPFKLFSPPGIKYLLLGSFTANSLNSDPEYDWYYSSKRNQFWPILEQVYHRPLQDKISRQKLFTELSLGVGDIIYQCERKKSNSLDNNLIHIVYNHKAIEHVLSHHTIDIIFFSSRFVEKEFKRHFSVFSKIKSITLPSPSPRYAAMTKSKKIEVYGQLLPHLSP